MSIDLHWSSSIYIDVLNFLLLQHHRHHTHHTHHTHHNQTVTLITTRHLWLAAAEARHPLLSQWPYIPFSLSLSQPSLSTSVQSIRLFPQYDVKYILDVNLYQEWPSLVVLMVFCSSYVWLSWWRDPTWWQSLSLCQCFAFHIRDFYP